MSHLAHIVKLKQSMISAGVVDVGVQKSVINKAFTLAVMKYLFTHSYVFTGYTEEVDNHILDRLSQWNEVTPINGGYIINEIRGISPALTNAGMDLGRFHAYPPAVATEYDYLNCEIFKGLVDWLNKELVTGND